MTETTQPGGGRATMEKNAACGPAKGGESPSQTHTAVSFAYRSVVVAINENVPSPTLLCTRVRPPSSK
jgi:hypothetical protein